MKEDLLELPLRMGDLASLLDGPLFLYLLESTCVPTLDGESEWHKDRAQAAGESAPHVLIWVVCV